VITEFENMIVWKSSGASASEDVPEPMPGLDAQFDESNKRCDTSKEHLSEYLESVRQQLCQQNPKSDQSRIQR